MTAPTPAPSSAPTFVLIGHCTPDAGMLRSAVGRVASNATFVSVNRLADLAQHRRPGAIWLVNRALDGDFGAHDGPAIVAEGCRGDGAPVVLLISNYADAQDAAVATGALRGFGKQALYAEATGAAIRAAIDAAARAAVSADRSRAASS